MSKNVITVEKADIKKIGNTAFEQDGNLSIVCNGDTANIEEILLRNILKCFGDDYKVVSAEDDIWVNVKGEEVYDILFTTNLPYELFEEVWHSEDSIDAGTMPNTTKRGNKIVKKILTIIMLVFIGLAANAQEVHGYAYVISNKLESVGLKVTDRHYGIVNPSAKLKLLETFAKSDKYYIKSDVYKVFLTTPKYYDLEKSRLAVENILKQYSDVILMKDWEIQPKSIYFPTAKAIGTYYKCDDTFITVVIVNEAETDDYSSHDYCTVALYEIMVGENDNQ